MVHVRACLSSAALAFLIAATAGAGSISGTLHAPMAAPGSKQVDPYAGSARSLPGAHMMQRGLVTDAVVYVDEVPVGSNAGAPPETPRLTQKDQMFAPRVVAVARGNAVDFPNMDPIFHNVFRQTKH